MKRDESIFLYLINKCTKITTASDKTHLHSNTENCIHFTCTREKYLHGIPGRPFMAPVLMHISKTGYFIAFEATSKALQLEYGNCQKNHEKYTDYVQIVIGDIPKRFLKITFMAKSNTYTRTPSHTHMYNKSRKKQKEMKLL